MGSRHSLGNRVIIQAVDPCLEGGRWAAKAVVGDDVIVAADILREGHHKLAAAIRYRGPDDGGWREAPMELDSNDRWYGHFTVDRVGSWRYTLTGWTDHYATWLDGVRKKHAAGQADLGMEFEEGARLLERRTRVRQPTKAALRELAEVLRSDAPDADKVDRAGAPEILALLAQHPERVDATIYRPELPLWVDRSAARFSAWYELFPRSEGAVVPSAHPPSRRRERARSGTLKEAAKRLPAIADMGFDVVYLPPIHPIGGTNRKGRGGPQDLSPQPDDPGVPWAIGSEAGGHTAVHPELGALEDFDDFVTAAGNLGLEVAMDFAIQSSPDHPWVHEHPEWFQRRPDGSIAFAENPPKKYQDIYPIDFDTPDYEGLRTALKGVLEFWIDRGIRIFRVDNPHTKALPFWDWLIAEIRKHHPETIFLAEAFTRPKMMQTLAKIGFNQSYTYFAWRNSKQELTDYVTELARTDMRHYFRPSFWPNTPDILTEYLQTGGRPAFKIRLVLAALLSPAYGIYSGYELCENVALERGSEEYWASEKYFFKPRDWDRPDSLAPYIGRINRIRNEHAAFQRLTNIWFHHIDNDHLLCFSKVARDRTDPVLVVVNLDPHRPREGTTWLDLWQLGLEHAGPFEAHDLMTDTPYVWSGPGNYVRLDPLTEPAHVLALRPL